MDDTTHKESPFLILPIVNGPIAQNAVSVAAPGPDINPVKLEVTVAQVAPVPLINAKPCGGAAPIIVNVIEQTTICLFGEPVLSTRRVVVAELIEMGKNLKLELFLHISLACA